MQFYRNWQNTFALNYNCKVYLLHTNLHLPSSHLQVPNICWELIALHERGLLRGWLHHLRWKLIPCGEHARGQQGWQQHVVDHHQLSWAGHTKIMLWYITLQSLVTIIWLSLQLIIQILSVTTAFLDNFVINFPVVQSQEEKKKLKPFLVAETVIIQIFVPGKALVCFLRRIAWREISVKIAAPS